jgi:hypothetical protein
MGHRHTLDYEETVDASQFRALRTQDLVQINIHHFKWLHDFLTHDKTERLNKTSTLTVSGEKSIN